jgi:hypothetical protein
MISLYKAGIQPRVQRGTLYHAKHLDRPQRSCSDFGRFNGIETIVVVGPAKGQTRVLEKGKGTGKEKKRTCRTSEDPAVREFRTGENRRNRTIWISELSKFSPSGRLLRVANTQRWKERRKGQQVVVLGRKGTMVSLSRVQVYRKMNMTA